MLLYKAGKQVTHHYETEQRQLQMKLEAEKHKATLALHQAREDAHTALLNMLSHDFKGSILSLETHLAQLGGNAQLSSELSHILHSIMAIKHRSATTPLKMKPEGQSAALDPLLVDLALLFPEVKFQGLDVDVAIVPCLLHLALYQLFRNARIHGGGACTCTVTREDSYAIISILNLPGRHHEKLVDAGFRAMELAQSGAVGTVSSSGLGLKDMSRILGFCSCEFTIKWRKEDVLAQIRLPIATRRACVGTLGESVSVRVCVVDDQFGARMMAPKLINMFHPDYKAPPKLKPINAVWQDDLVKVAGATSNEVHECIQWVNQTDKATRTIVILDRMLEFPGCVLDGLNLIPDFTANGAVVVVRSGNDSDKDKQLYIERGAFGSIDKVLHSGSQSKYVLMQAKECILIRHIKRSWARIVNSVQRTRRLSVSLDLAEDLLQVLVVKQL